MVSSEERQRVIEANRSLRNIKNELEALLEKGILSDDAFDSIQSLLPTESSISASGGRASAPQRAAGLPTPTATPSSPAAPPSYAQSTGSSTPTSGPPPLPGRNQPPAAPPGKPVLAHAKALYKYAASDARDCNLERGDRVAVYEYMNADWWMGKNLRTGQEGIFPKSYVEPEAAPVPAPSHVAGGWNEKANVDATYQGYQGYQAPPQPQYAPGPGGYPAPPGQMNPYNAHAPPMAMANQGQQQQEEGGSKVGETGKKIGKKLGNAAIFGAGATIGSNLVNSIF
ncbi:hypothetical protein B0H67DRAFT_477478 [Lasiosphaeris hirsuta]|uniref:SH3 domain-containing protein n=1 Tax=Lasiosphaeris hirsuta TaxID=260670 RepID=A0AA40B931_9PEZI|nr:hypothetical protein B0H67DRAFT_477478 [Lasiosphaeris hirsuta]